MEEFCGILGRIKIATFYEDKETKTGSGDKYVYIVPPAATIIGIKDEFPTGMACQHHLLTSPNDLGDIRFHHLWRRITEFTTAASTSFGDQIPPPDPHPLLRWYLPSPASNFFGRETALAAIKRVLQSNGNLVVGESLTIYGLRGMGKSELVLQYIKEPEQQNIYSATLWVKCTHRIMMFESLRLIYNELSFRCPYMEHELHSLQNPSGQITRIALRAAIRGITKRLAALSARPWLVVLDDLQFEIGGIEKLAAPNGQIIVTTTEPRGRPSNLLEIQGVCDAGAFQIITQTRRLGKNAVQYSGPIGLDDVEIVNRKLGGNPFALNMIGAATYSTGFTGSSGDIPSLSSDLSMPKFQREDFLAYANSLDVANYILSVVNLTFAKVEAVNSASRMAIAILGHFSPTAGVTSTSASLKPQSQDYLPTTDTTNWTLEKWVKYYEKSRAQSQTFDFKYFTGVEARNLVQNTDHIWGLLRFFGIINYTADAETNQSRLLPHPIIQTWIQRHLSATQETECLLFVGMCLSDPGGWLEAWPQLYSGEMASHLRNYFDHVDRLGFFRSSPENPFVKYQGAISVLENLAMGLKLVRDSDRYLKTSQLALDLWDFDPVKDPIRLYDLTCKVSKSYWDTGNPERGLEVVQRSIKLEGNAWKGEPGKYQIGGARLQRDKMRYQLAKLDGEQEEDVDELDDSDYEIPEGGVTDILEILSGKYGPGKLVEIMSQAFSCDPADYDPDVLFQLLRYDVNLHTQEAESMEAEFIIRAFQSFIENDISLEWSDHSNTTILHFAAKENYSLIVEILLKYSSRFDINAIDFSGMTPLACAIMRGSSLSAQLLIQGGAKLDFRPRSTSPPILFRALSAGIELRFLRYLLESGLKDTINEPYSYHGTVLHHAAVTCSASVVNLLLEYGADANALNYMRLTPLALAITLGYADGVLEPLLARTDMNLLDYRGRHVSLLRCRGSDVSRLPLPNHSTRYGQILFQQKQETEEAEVLIYYWLRSQSYRPPGYKLEVPSAMYHILMHAGFKKFAVLVRGHEKALLVDKKGGKGSGQCSLCGKEIDYMASAFVCVRCCPALFCSDCRQNDSQTTQRPRDCKPDYDVKLTESNFRPISNGRGFQFKRVVRNSIYRGTENTFQDLYPERHILWGLVGSGQLGSIKEYVEAIPTSSRAGFDSDTKDFTGYTILHFAAEEEQDNVFIYLASQGADMDASDMAGWSVAHSAATAARLTILKYMAAEGANLNVQDAYGRTPLHVAVLEGNLETIKLLLQIGADQGIVDEDCRHPCEMACISPEIKETFLRFRHATAGAPQVLNLKQDPTSESRWAIKARMLNDDAILPFSPLAYVRDAD
ncbi:hypothetical protein TWF481_007716 [Arthrobotrys musiformis]|uniref:Orc1-like AAA ATPase domain-containing protein n=1 Tax=Arthrobotrys musiformis TaxID=47236 RepID=A0AAV9WDK6_9PEZI